MKTMHPVLGEIEWVTNSNSEGWVFTSARELNGSTQAPLSEQREASLDEIAKAVEDALSGEFLSGVVRWWRPSGSCEHLHVERGRVMPASASAGTL